MNVKYAKAPLIVFVIKDIINVAIVMENYILLFIIKYNLFVKIATEVKYVFIKERKINVLNVMVVKYVFVRSINLFVIFVKAHIHNRDKIKYIFSICNKKAFCIHQKRIQMCKECNIKLYLINLQRDQLCRLLKIIEINKKKNN